MVRNEKTSKRVASIAAKVMTFEGLRGLHGKATLFTCGSSGEYNNAGVTVAEVRALAASCLTQAPDAVCVSYKRMAAARKAAQRKARAEKAKPKRKAPSRSPFYPAATPKRRSP